MLHSVIKLIIGDPDEKRAYRKMMKRVDALPKDYRFAFRKIQHYMFTVGAPDGDTALFTDLTMFTDLVDLLEEGAAEGRQVLDITGSDVGRFSDEFMLASAADAEKLRQNRNREVAEKLNREGR